MLEVVAPAPPLPINIVYILLTGVNVLYNTSPPPPPPPPGGVPPLEKPPPPPPPTKRY